MDNRLDKTHIVVLGTGVPKDILTDGNYERFLSVVMEHIELFRNTKDRCHVYLCGGSTNTNFPDRTEAGEMKRWFDDALNPEKDSFVTFHIVDNTIDTWGTIDTLRDVLCLEFPAIYVEYARQDTTRLLAKYYLPWFKLFPVHYDITKNPNWERIKRIPKAIMIWAGLRNPTIREYSIRKRKQYIKEWSEKTDQKP